MDFFLMLSSISGVLGLVSQANYGAGNTFQDALARHRTAEGLPAVAIDLPAVSQVGVVTGSDDTSMRGRIERAVGFPVGLHRPRAAARRGRAALAEAKTGPQPPLKSWWASSRGTASPPVLTRREIVVSLPCDWPTAPRGREPEQARVAASTLVKC
ncbi:unnamed protein product [Discula destructiva]